MTATNSVFIVNHRHLIQLSRYEFARALLQSGERVPDFAWFADFAIPSTANLREHFRAKAKRAQAQRMGGRVLSTRCPKPLSDEIWLFILTRCAPKQLDSDNCAIAFKSVRDGIADRIGINDKDPRIIWHYEQEKSKTARVKFEAWKINP